jgi:hypothetical protein
MCSSKYIRLILIIVVLSSLALLVSACGGGKRGVSGRTSAPVPTSINDAISELDRMPVPDGVDPAVFGQLKDALRAALVARGTDKIASTPPSGAVNGVPDAALTDVGDGTFNATWHYYNVGDYNQDGVVSIADITPLAMHYGQTWSKAVPAEVNTLAAVVDGSNNEKVDIADVTPIAMNFGVMCDGYIIEQSDAQGGTYTQVGNITLDFGLNKDTARMDFTFNLVVAPNYWYRVSPYDHEDAVGQPGNEVQAPPPGAQVPVASILPNTTFGFSPLTVSFNAAGSIDPDGGTINRYEFDGDGDGVYEADGTNPLYEFTYTTAGAFHPVVRVTDDELQTDTATTTINVTEVPAYDEVENNDDAASANALPPFPVVDFYGSLGQHPPLYPGYDGDQNDWFSFAASEGETVTITCAFNPTLTVGMELRDNEGDILETEPVEASPQQLIYTFQPGDTSPFMIGLSSVGYSDYSLAAVYGQAPEADIVAFPDNGYAPLDVQLDAGASTDDGTIDKYEWDWEGDGTWDSDTGTTPITNHVYGVAGTYHPAVRVTDNDGLSSTDSADVVVTTLIYDETENNDTPATGNPLPAFPFTGYLGSIGNDGGYPGYDGDAEDYFTFNAIDGGTYSFRLNFDEGTGLQAQLAILDVNNNLVASNMDVYSGQQISYTFGPGEAGLAKVRVNQISGGADYTLDGAQTRIPTALLVGTPRIGSAPLGVAFDGSGSTDDGTIVKFEFDWNADGTYELDSGNDPTVNHTFSSDGVYKPVLRVTDNLGFWATDSYTITVGSTGYSEIEDNDSIIEANALPILPVSSWTGSLGDLPPLYEGYDADNVDYFSFIGPGEGDTITVTVNFASSMEFQSYLYDSDGDILTSYWSLTPPATMSYTFAAGDTAPYYISLTAPSGYGDYSMDVVPGAPPVADLLADGSYGTAPFLVSFDASNSYDIDGVIVSYDYDWTGDGTFELIGGTAWEAHEYDTDGFYTPTVRANDNSGYTDTDSVWVFVGSCPYNERENNDDESSANPLFPFNFASMTGSCGTSDTYPGYDGDNLDIFTFSANEGDAVSFYLSFSYLVADIDMEIYDSSGSGIPLMGSYNWQDNEWIDYTFTASDTGPYFLYIEGISGGADYSLDGSLIPF